MTDFGSWMQDNWLELAGLLFQLAFLIAGVWFARNILKSMRAFQEQIGALLKISLTSGSNERPLSNTDAKPSLKDVSPYWLPPSQEQPLTLSDPVESGPGLLTRIWRGTISWLKTPMSAGGVGPLRRAIRWLQAPARS
jgi:hypothetical protein